MKKLNLQLFADEATLNANTTTQAGSEGKGNLLPEIKQYYNKKLLENARPELFFAQFGNKTELPKGNGHEAEWRQWETFDPKVSPLTEGVTPTGDKMGVRVVTAEVHQFGRYATITDRLELEAYDPVILGATEEMGATAAEVKDIVTRNTLVSSSNIAFAPKSDGTAVTTAANLDGTCLLTSKLVNKMVTILKKNKTPKINGSYIAIIHPSVAMDLRNSDGWEEAHKYCSPDEIYNGEIGRLHGCRFVETTNAKVYNAGSALGTSTVPQSNSAYSCIFFGKDAYGLIDPEGAGLEMIVKGKGSAGTSDPLNQRSTVGYKFSTGSAILHPERLINCIVTSSFGADDSDIVVE